MSDRTTTSGEAMATVERWRALLKLGVPLKVPETEIPYCDTDRSSLHYLGWEMFQRQDEWHAYEQGHGRYGSVASADLPREDLDNALAGFATKCPQRVIPWTDAVPEADKLSPSDTLTRVRAGGIALARWYGPTESGVTDVVVGDGGALYWLRRQGAKLVRVERLAWDWVPLLESLPIARSAVTAATPEHHALATRAKEHLARHDSLVRALDADPSRFIGPSHAREGTTRGARFHWISFWDATPALKTMVVDQTPYVVSVVVARALFEDPTVQLCALDPALRTLLSQREDALAAIYDALRGGRMAYQRNSSIAMWWAWVDGVGYEVDVTSDGIPSAAVMQPALTPPTTDCASHGQHGAHADRFHAVDERWMTALRQVIAGAARGDDTPT